MMELYRQTIDVEAEGRRRVAFQQGRGDREELQQLTDSTIKDGN